MNEIKIYPYSDEFIRMFEDEKKSIVNALPSVEVHHIGSTAIPRIGGKGIIDILIAISDWNEKDDAVVVLKSLGFLHIHPEEDGRIFLSKVGPTTYGDTHIHLVEQGNREYKEKLLFRDYLRKNKKDALEYEELKHQWLQEAHGDRKKNRILKISYVQNIIPDFCQRFSLSNTIA